MQQIIDMDYRAAIYLRLSQEDGDISISDNKSESNSISTQRDLIHVYLKSHPEITYVTEFCDDGFTGTNFERPGFEAMIDAVKNKLINCIIVKDLSRFGRDYIETGRYIQKLFPMLKIRFIAINDGFDSADPNKANDFILPFKNLINDTYCRDISIKSRTNLDVKRRNGEFVNNFTVYGYMRNPEDKHKLIVDKQAAEVVRKMFSMKQEGHNAQQIANLLNSIGVHSPMEYKRKCGSNFQTKFKTKAQAEWSAKAVIRILSNPVYTGVLIQGRTSTPNYKVKTPRIKDESEWARVDNTHEAIITQVQFDLVQKLLRMDTCRAIGEENIYPLSGIMFCADCGNTIVHRAVYSAGKKYMYYSCSSGIKSGSDCSNHNMRCEKVEAAVLATLQAHIAAVIDIDTAMKEVEALDWERREIVKINAQIASSEADVERFSRLKLDLYEDMKCEIISKDEYHSYKAEYDEKIQAAKCRVSKLVGERNAVSNGFTDKQGWFAQFRKYGNIDRLDRLVVVSLIERIEINKDKEINVVFNHADQFTAAREYLADREQTTENKIIRFREVDFNGTGIPQAARQDIADRVSL